MFPSLQPCDKIISTFEYSTNLCMKYQLKVRGLSGKGMQISPSVEDPDRGCRVACQDKFIGHRFYLVNGDHGFYPYGTKCSFKNDDKRYCVNGKCLKFGEDDTPLNGNFHNNFNIRSKRSLANRNRRHYTYYAPVNFNESVSQEYLNRLVLKIDFQTRDKDIETDQIDLNNPVFVYSNENFYD